jgi:hypothetical protein
MPAEETPDLPMYGPAEEGPWSSEQIALSDFAYCLGSCNFTTEPRIADEGSTRKEATLLMSLLGSPPHLDEEDQELTVSSQHEVSYSSDSSYSRKETFSFTCPSLSLENSKNPFTDSLRLDSPRRRVSDLNEPVETKQEKPASSEMPLPAELLGRPLTVDDRDALRLSADAMARNVLQSFQKAIDWRIQAWIDSLSAKLVQKEQEMIQAGATQDDVRTLLETSPAKLIVMLQAVRENIHVTGAGTTFRVLSQRVENDDSTTQQPSLKRRRLAEEHPKDLQEGEYQYSVTHSLVLEAVVNLQTPAGYSEITLQVPGTMDGTFLSIAPALEELKSVVVELDTNILTAMVEKSCRLVVRASMEAAMERNESQPAEEEAGGETQVRTTTTTTEMDAMSLMTPPTRQITSDITAELVRASIVTPRNLFDGDASNENTTFSRNKRVLLPIPDDFEKSLLPRRISPQPHSSPDFTGSIPFTPRKELPGCGGPSLISPPLKSEASDYLDNNTMDKGPSLPMLVEVACRAMRVD